MVTMTDGGNPFLHTDVLAQACYDVLESRAVPMEELAMALPRMVTSCFPPKFRQFLMMYPDLFHVFRHCEHTTVQRAELPRREQHDKVDVTEQETTHAVISAVPMPFDPARPLHSDYLYSRLSHDVRREVRRRHGTFIKFLNSHPEAFVLYPISDRLCQVTLTNEVLAAAQY